MQQLLTDFIVKKISVLTQIPLAEISLDKPIINLGLNSLMLTELNLAIEDKFALEPSFSVIEEGASIHILAKLLTNKAASIEN